MKKIISLFFVVLSVCSCLCFPVFGASDERPLDSTTIEEDFKSCNLDIEQYLENEAHRNEHHIVTAREYGYTKRGRDYSLYLYVYVDESKNIDYSLDFTPEIEVVLASSFDDVGNPVTYTTKYAKLIDVTEDGYFHKFRIDLFADGKEEYEDGRLYYVSDVNIRLDDWSWVNGSLTRNIIDELCIEDVNRAFYFTGSESSGLSLNGSQDKVIDLDVHPTIYRTVSSDKGTYYQYDVFSVYFSIPNIYLEKYDYLRGISYKYYEAMWNAMVTDDKQHDGKIYIELQEMVDKDFSGNYNGDYDSIYVNYSHGNMSPGIWDAADIVINPYPFKNATIFDTKLSKFVNLFKVQDYKSEDWYISGSNVSGFLDTAETPENYGWNYKTTTLDDTFDINGYYSGGAHAFEKWWRDLTNNNRFDRPETNLQNVAPIVKIDDAFFENYDISRSTWCDTSLVHEDEAADFKAYYETSKANDETMYLLRFAVRNYYAAPAVVEKHNWTDPMDEHAVYAQGTGFKNFNVISLTFRKGANDFLVLVNSEPQDIVSGVTPPVEPNPIIKPPSFNIDFPDLSGAFQKIGIILGVIALLVVILIVSKPIGALLGLIPKRKEREKDRVEIVVKTDNSNTERKKQKK